MRQGVLRIVLSVVFMTILVAVSGCSQISDLTETSSQKSPDIIRGSDLGGEWRMDQLVVTVEPDNQSLVLLRLNTGDKVDGYFYVEKGEGIGFQITGNSLVYESKVKDNGDATEVVSDRFSFTGSRAQGNTYNLTFRNPAEDGQGKVTVFVELIYPIGCSLFTPIER